MSDDAIIQAMKCCNIDHSCASCPMRRNPYCLRDLLKNATLLLERQEETINYWKRSYNFLAEKKKQEGN